MRGAGRFLGERSRSLLAGDFQIELRTATVPHDEVEAHAHDDAHFVLALSPGYRSLALASQPAGRPVAPGLLVWNPPGVEHRDCFDETGSRFLSISFAPPLLARRGDPLWLRGRAEGLARRLAGLVAAGRPGAAQSAEALALDLAASVLDAADLGEDPAPDWVRRGDEMIADLANRPGLEVRHIAALLGVHPVSLARRYRRHFGVSPAAAIRKARVDRAAGALIAGQPLVEAAMAAGFADQSHMTRDFAAVFGTSPARLRSGFSTAV